MSRLLGNGALDGTAGPGLRVLAAMLLAGLVLNFLVRLPATAEVRTIDFPGYHRSAQLVLEGRSEELYRSEVAPFTNLPIVSVLLAPLGRLEYADAWRVMWWLNLCCFAASFGLLLGAIARFFPPLSWPGALLASLIFLAFAPVMRRCLVLGQTTPLMLLAFTGFYWLCRSGWSRSAGALLGLVCLIKIPPILIVGLLALRRRTSLALTAVGVVTAGVLLSLLLFGTDLVGQYADRVLWDNLGRTHAAFNNQSLDGAFMRLLTDRGLTDWRTAVRPLPVGFAVGISAAAIAILLGWRGRRLVWPTRVPDDADPSRGSLELELALGSTLMLLVFPIVWIHYYLFLAVPMALLPFWWRHRGLPWSWPGVALLAVGIGLAAGPEVAANAHYREHQQERGFRLQQNQRVLGAVILTLALAAPLAELARREPNRGLGGDTQPID